MKKRSFVFLLIAIFLLFFSGCTISFGRLTIRNFTVTEKKPSRYYYSNNLIKDLTEASNISVKLLDTNFYKEKKLSKDDIDTIKSFAKSLKKANFIDKPKDLVAKPPYKLFFTMDKDKYIVNVYDEKYITVYPFDGTYTMDYVDMNGIQNLYNLYGLCKYLIPR